MRQPILHRMTVLRWNCGDSVRSEFWAILLILLTSNISFGNVMVQVGALLTLAWMRFSRTRWREIGYVRPRSWIGAVVAGAALGVGFKFLLKAIVMPALGADPVTISRETGLHFPRPCG